jgi:hypothetical protein
VFAAGIADRLTGIDELLMSHLPGDAHLRCEIETADQQNIYSVHRGDLIRVLHPSGLSIITTVRTSSLIAF